MGVENSFNSGYDPLLSGNNNTSEEVQEAYRLLQEKRASLEKEKSNAKEPNQSMSPLWDSIDEEMLSLSDSQKNIMASENEYQQNESQLMALIQGEILSIVRPRIEQNPEGKKLLEAQYKFVKDKKKQVIDESNKELESFTAFKMASLANPGLTYAEFIEAYNS